MLHFLHFQINMIANILLKVQDVLLMLQKIK